jgi:hypothetical protein
MKPEFFDGCAVVLLVYGLAMWYLLALETAVVLTAISILIIVLGIAAYLVLDLVSGRIMPGDKERNRSCEASSCPSVTTFQLLALGECFRKGDFARLKNENCLSAAQSR